MLLEALRDGLAAVNSGLTVMVDSANAGLTIQAATLAETLPTVSAFVRAPELIVDAGQGAVVDAGINARQISQIDFSLADGDAPRAGMRYGITLEGQQFVVDVESIIGGGFPTGIVIGGVSSALPVDAANHDLLKPVLEALAAKVNAAGLAITAAAVSSEIGTDSDGIEQTFLLARLTLTGDALNAPFTVAENGAQVSLTQILSQVNAVSTLQVQEGVTALKQQTSIAFSGAVSPDLEYIARVDGANFGIQSGVTAGLLASADLSTVLDNLAAAISAGSNVDAVRSGDSLNLTSKTAGDSFTVTARTENKALKTPTIASDYVLNMPTPQANFGLNVEGNFTVVSLPIDGDSTVSLSSDKNLVIVDPLDAGTGTVTLSAGNSLAFGGTVTAGKLDLTLGGELSLNSQVDELSIDMTLAGAGVQIIQVGDLDLSRLNLKGGDVTLNVVGDLVIGDFIGTAGNVTINVTGSVSFNADAGYTPVTMERLNITAGGGVSGHISTDNLSIQAVGSVSLSNLGASPMVVSRLDNGGADIFLSSQGSIQMDALIAAEGSADLVLMSESGSLTLNDDVTSGSGLIDLDAANDLILNNSASIRSVSGAFNLTSGNDLVLGNETLLDGGVGAFTLVSGGDMTLAQLVTESDADVRLSAAGAITNVLERGVAITAGAEATLVIEAGAGVGTELAPLTTELGHLQLLNTGTGVVSLQNAGGLLIESITQTNGNVSLETIGGTVVIEGDISLEQGDFTLYAGAPNSAILVEGDIVTQGGSVTLTTEDGDITFSGRVFVNGDGNVSLQAPQGRILVDPAQSGWLRDDGSFGTLPAGGVSTAAFDSRIDWVIREGKLTSDIAGVSDIAISDAGGLAADDRTIDLSSLAPEPEDLGATYRVAVAIADSIQVFDYQANYSAAASTEAVLAEIASGLVAAINSRSPGFVASADGATITLANGAGLASIAVTAKGALRADIADNDINAQLRDIPDGLVLRVASAPLLYTTTGEVVVSAQGEIGRKLATDGGVMNDGGFDSYLVRETGDNSVGFLASPLALVIDTSLVSVESASRANISLITLRGTELANSGTRGGSTDLTNLDFGGGAQIISAPIDAAGQDIVLVGNSLTINSDIRSADADLSIRPKDSSQSISIGGNVGEDVEGTLSLATEELDKLQDGFKNIVIGSESGGHTISINQDTEFKDNLMISTPGAGGEVMVNSDLSAPAVTIRGSGNTTYLTNSGVTSTNGPLLIEDSIVVSGDAHLRSLAGSITVRPGSDGNGSINANAASSDINRLELEAAGSVTFEGNIGGEGDVTVDVKPLDQLTILSATNVLFNKSVLLSGDLIINATGEVRFKQSLTLDDGGSLIINGAGSVVFESGEVNLNGQRDGRGGDILIEADQLTVTNLANDAIRANATGSQFIVRSTSDNRPVLLGDTVQGTASTLNLSTTVIAKINDASFDRFVVGHQQRVVDFSGLSVDASANLAEAGDYTLTLDSVAYTVSVSAGSHTLATLATDLAAAINASESYAFVAQDEGLVYQASAVDGQLIITRGPRLEAVQFTAPAAAGSAEIQDQRAVNRAANNVTVGVTGSDSSNDFLLNTNLEVYGSSILVEDSEFSGRWLKVRGDLKLDAIRDITIGNRVDALDAELYSMSGQIAQQNPSAAAISLGDGQAGEPIRVKNLVARGWQGVILPFLEIDTVNVVNAGISGDILLHNFQSRESLVDERLEAGSSPRVSGDLVVLNAAQLSATGGDISITTVHGEIEIAASGQGVVSASTEGDITLEALADDSAGDNLFGIVVAQRVQAVSGDIVIKAGQQIQTLGDGRIESIAGGSVALTSRNEDIVQGANILSRGGVITLTAGRDILMASDTLTDASADAAMTGQIELFAGRNIELWSLSATTNMTLTADTDSDGQGWIRATSGFAADEFNLDGASTNVALSASQGIGEAAAYLATRIEGIQATNTAQTGQTATGGLFIREADHLETRGNLVIAGDSGAIGIVLLAGDLVLNHVLASTGASGNVLLDVAGDVMINQSLNTTSGDVSVLASGGIVMGVSAEVRAGGQSATIELVAMAGAVTTSRVQSNQGNIRIDASAGIVLNGAIDARSAADRSGGSLDNQAVWGQVSLTAEGGSVSDNRVVITPAVFASDLRIQASAAIGASGAAIEIEAATFAALAAAGSLFVNEATDLSVDAVADVAINRVALDATTTQVPVTAGADLEGLTIGAGTHALVLNADTGTLILDSAVSVTEASHIRIQALAGNLTINQAIETATGHISLIVSDLLTQAAAGSVTTSGSGTVDARANAITMAAGATVTADSGNVRYAATNTLALGAISTDGSVSLSASSISDSNGAAINVTANELRLVTTGTNAGQGAGSGADHLETTVTRLAADIAGLGGLYLTETDDLIIGQLNAINVNQVGANGTTLTATTDVALGNLASAGSLVLVTEGGALTTVASTGTVTAAGNLLLQAGGASSDLTLNAAVTSTGGHISLDAGQAVLQNADISATGAGNSIDVVAGGNVTMGAGTTTTSNNGNVRVEATAGSIVSNIITTGSGSDYGSAALIAGQDIDNIGGDSLITASGLLLDANGTTSRIGGSGSVFNTAVDMLSASGGSGGLFVTETNGLNVGEVSVTVERVAADAITAATTADVQEDLSTSADGAIVLTVTTGDVTIEGGTDTTGINATGTGNVRLQSTAGQLTLNAGLNAGSGNITLLSALTFSQAADGDILTTDGHIYVQAIGDVSMAHGATSTTTAGNIRYQSDNALALGSLNTTSGYVSLLANSITDSGAVDNTDQDIAAQSLRVEVTGNNGGFGVGDNHIHTNVGTLSVVSAGMGGVFITETDAIVVDQVAAITTSVVEADGEIASEGTTDIAQSDLVSAGTLVLQTLAGAIILNEGNDNSRSIEAAGNLLLRSGGVTSDLTLNAAVTSTGGHISLDAGQNLFQNADINATGAGNSIDVVAGGAITLVDETQTVSNSGNIRYAANAGNLTVSSLNAGDADVSLVAQRILDGGDSHTDIIANNLRLNATVGIGNNGVAVDAIDSLVVTLSARAAAGGIYINEVDALTLDAVGPLTVSHVLSNGSVTTPENTASVRTNAAQTQVAVTSSGSVVIEAGSILANPDGGQNNLAVNAGSGAGNVRLQARGDNQTSGNLDIQGRVRGGSGNISLIAANDVKLAGLADVLNTTASTSIELNAGRDIVMASAATVTSVGKGSVRFEAGGNIQLATINVGATSSAGGVALLAGGAIIDAHDSQDDQASGKVNVVASSVLMSAADGIGASTDLIETTVFKISANAGSAGLFLFDTSSVSVDAVSVTTQRVQSDATLAGVNNTPAGPFVDSQIDLVALADGAVVVRAASGLTVNSGGDTGDGFAVTAAGTGKVSLEAIAGTLTLNSAAGIDAGAGNVSLRANSAILQNANVVTSGAGRLDYLANGANTASITMSGGVLAKTADGNVQLAANGNITLGLNAGIESVSGNLQLTSSVGNISVNDGFINVGGNLDLDSDGNTTLTGTLDIAGTSDLTVGENLLITGDYTGGDNVTLTVTGTTDLTGTLAVTNDLLIDGTGAITLADTVTTTGNATITGGASVSLNGSLDVGGNLNLDSVNNTTLIGTLDIAGTSDLTVGENLLITGDYTGGDNVTLTVTGTTDLTGTLAVTNDLLIDGTGAITLADTVTATGNATITGGASVSLNGSLDVNGALDLDSDGNTTLTGILDVAGISDLNIGGNLGIDGSYTGNNDVTMTVTGTTDLIGTLAVTNDLLIDGTGAITLADTVTATGNATITGGASVSLNGSLDVDGNLDLDSVSNTTLIGTLDIAGTSDLTVGENLLITGDYTGGDNVTMTVTGTTDLTGTLAVTNDLQIDGTGAITLADTVTTTGNATITGGANVSLNGSLDVDGSLDLNSVNNTTLIGTLDIAGTSDVTVGENLLITGDYTGGDSVTLTVTGTIALSTGESEAFTIGGALALTSVGNATLSGTFIIDGISTLTVGDENTESAFDLTGTLTGKDGVTLTVTGTTDLTGALAVTNDLLIDGTGAITLADTVTATGNATITGGDSVSLNGSLDVDGSLDLDSVNNTTLIGTLDIAGTSDVTVGENLLITGDYAGGDNVTLTVTGTTDLAGALAVTNDLLIDGTGAITLADTVTTTGNATITGGASVSLNGSLDVGGNLDLDSVGNTTLTGTSAIEGASTLTVGSASTVDANAIISALSITGGFTGLGNVILDVTGSTTVDGTFTVGDEANNSASSFSLTGDGAIVLGSEAADDIVFIVAGNATIDGKSSVSLNGSLNVDGSLNLDSVNNTTLIGTLDIAGTSDLTVGENLLITGDYTGGDNVTMTVTGTTDLTGTLAVTNDLLIDSTGAITLANTIIGSGNATVNGGASVATSGTLDVTGALVLTSATDSNLNGTVNVGGISDLTVGGDLAITGVYTGGDNATLMVSGTTDLDGSLNITNDLQLDGTGAITLVSSVIVSGNAKVNGADSVTTFGTLNIAGNLLVTADKAINLADTITVGGSATMDGKASVNVASTLNVTGALALTSATSSTLTGTVNVDGTSNLIAGGDLAITGDYTGGDNATLTVAGSTDLDGTLDVTNDLLLDGTGAITLANSVIVSGNATINGSDTAATTGLLTVAGNLLINADEAINLADTITVGGSATVDGKASVNVASTLNVTGALALTSATDSTLNGTVNVGGISDLNVGGDLVITGDYTGGDNATLTVAGSTDLDGSLNITNDLQLDGIGAITLANSVIVSDNATVNGADSVTTFGTLNIAGNLLVTADKTINLADTVTVGGNATVDGKTRVDVASTLNVTGALALTSATDSTLNGTVNVGGTSNLNVGGNLSITGDYIGGDSVTLSVEGSTDLDGSLNITNDLQLDGTGAITLADTITISSNATVNGGASVATSGTLDVTDALVLTSATDSTLNGTVNVGGISDLNVGGDLAITGDYTGGDNATLTVAGSTDLDGSLNITNDLQLDGTGAITLGNTVTVSGDATVNGAGSITTSGTLDVTGALALISGVDSTLNGTVNVGGTSNLNVGGNLSITGDYTGGDNATLTIAGSTDLDGSLNITNDLQLDGTGAITLGNMVTVSGDAIVNGAGSITTSGTLDVTGALALISATDSTLNGTVNVGGTSNLNVGGNLAITGDYTGGDSVTLSVEGTAVLDGTLDVTNDLLLDGTGAITLGDTVTVTNDATINGSDTVATTGLLTVAGNLLINADEAINLADTVTVGGNATVDGKASVDVASTLNVTGALALTSATSSTLTGTVNVDGTSNLIAGGNLAITGDYTGGDNATLTVAGTTDLDGSLNITNDLQLDGTGAITLADTITVSGNATVNGGASVTNFGLLDVNGALVLASATSSTLTGTVNVGGISDLNVGGNLAITGDYTGGDNATLTVAGSTDLDGSLNITNDLQLDGTGAITLANNVIVSGSATVNGDDSVTATGTLDVKDDLQITADKAISLSGTLKVGDTATGSALNLESAQNITVAAELSVQQINARSSNGDVRVVQQQAGDLSIGQIQAGNGAVSLSLLNGRLIGSPNSGLANVVADDLSTAAKGFALSNEQSSDLVNSIEQLSSQPLRVDVDRLRLLQVSSSDLLFNATGDNGTGFILSTGGLDSTLHLITTGNPDIETVVAPIEVTVEQFEQLRGLFFRSNAPDRDDIAIADVIARRHSEELSWFRERLSEDDLAAEDMTAYERQLQAALLSGAQSDTVRSLFTELLEPGFGLSESSEVSRVLGHVPGLQPLVTGDSPMNPYLYDMFMEDFQMVF
jgi:hypothetical protein